MPLETQLHLRGITLTTREEERIRRQIRALERRIEKFPDPRLELAIEQQAAPRGVEVDLRVALGPLGGHLVSHQAGPAADVAVKAAIDDAKRQLERRLSNQRGESTYGVPSRRLPAEMRPNPAGSQWDDTEDRDEDDMDDMDDITDVSSDEDQE